MPMTITEKNGYYVCALDGDKLTERDKEVLLGLTNEELEDELLDLMEEADKISRPTREMMERKFFI